MRPGARAWSVASFTCEAPEHVLLEQPRILLGVLVSDQRSSIETFGEAPIKSTYWALHPKRAGGVLHAKTACGLGDR